MKKPFIMTNEKQQLKQLQQTIDYAVENGFNQSVINDYNKQLLHLLIVVAKDKEKRRQFRIGGLNEAR